MTRNSTELAVRADEVRCERSVRSARCQCWYCAPQTTPLLETIDPSKNSGEHVPQKTKQKC